MVECSESKDPTTHKSTMATTLASDYWTATARHVMQAPPTQEEEAERWNQHKYGLCPMCKVGLDDKSEFTFNYANGSENGTMMCWGCDAKRKPKQTCSGCLSKVEDKDVLVATWDRRSRKNKVLRCSGCRH